MNRFTAFLMCTVVWFFVGVAVVYLGSSFTYLSWQEINFTEWQVETRCAAFVWLLICVVLSIGAVTSYEE